MDQLLQYLDSVYPLSPELRHYLSSILKADTLPKKEYLLHAGQICQNIYFIEKGLLRCFYLKEEREVCSWFMKEGDVIISVESFFKQQPSYESIQAMEDCFLYYIGYEELQYIYYHFHEFNFIGRMLTQKYYMLSEQRLYSLRMQKADERYHYMMEHFPELILRVPSKDIASYLGIRLETLSRMRSRR